MTEALPYRFVGELDKKAVADKFAVALGAWAKSWFQLSSGIDLAWLDSGKITSLSNEKWLIFGDAPDIWMAWKLDGVVTRDFLGMMFNTSVGSSVKPTPLMQDILKECVANLASEISQATGASALVENEQLLFGSLRVDQGSGFLLGELGGKFPRQVIAFGGGLVERAINRSPVNVSLDSLALRESAIGSYMANLQVTAGTAELTLHDLTHLEVGDVIRLDTLVKEPFVVSTKEGVPVAKAHLGIHGNHKAIQLIED